MKAAVYTLIALIAFAANSLFCRMALAEGDIDPYNFTIIRLLSGAACLGIIMSVTTYNQKRKGLFNDAILSDTGSWRSSISLLVYAVCFSVAYVELDTGTGALILFSAVQLTMIGWGIYNKEQLSGVQWTAFFVAVAGFVYLMLPSAAVPSLIGAGLMALSGVAWGVYSIRGKVCVSPLRTTGFNFVRSLVALPILLLVSMSYFNSLTIQGVLLACASGAIASGIGYSIWYVAMPLLKSTQAAVVQLCVPVIAAVAGVIFLQEQLTLEFISASLLILTAVLVFILNKQKE
ncbi:DMT family transporter [Pseudoalteromonas sp. 10-33]|uniref:DMT family transporter n=1 Tax=Pseudoalteromonas sp. 10-33 TaxID=1761890 RepID=UPI0007323575|nr:DMT family transporter [Pseudoalteromonas sp. 10-33]KTF14362.1 multidrug DMT transporter permease [Pseudoalteromonas sp. 10-33]